MMLQDGGKAQMIKSQNFWVGEERQKKKIFVLQNRYVVFQAFLSNSDSW